MEFPKWIKPHHSYGIDEVSKTHEVHHDRVIGATVLVLDAEDEGKLMSEKLSEEIHEEHHDKDEA